MMITYARHLVIVHIESYSFQSVFGDCRVDSLRQRSSYIEAVATINSKVDAIDVFRSD